MRFYQGHRAFRQEELASYIRENHLNLCLHLLERMLGLDCEEPLKDGMAAVLKAVIMDGNVRGYLGVVVPEVPQPGYEEEAIVKPYHEEW